MAPGLLEGLIGEVSLELEPELDPLPPSSSEPLEELSESRDPFYSYPLILTSNIGRLKTAHTSSPFILVEVALFKFLAFSLRRQSS